MIELATSDVDSSFFFKYYLLSFMGMSGNVYKLGYRKRVEEGNDYFK